MRRMYRGSCLGIAAVVLCGLSTGCATIVDGGKFRKVEVTSNPSGLPVEIYDAKKDRLVAQGTTPFSVKLKRASGYFAAARYRFTPAATTQPSQIIVTTPPSTQPSRMGLVKAKVNRWYFGNILIPGGSVGSLVVDPLTGAMWDLPKTVHLGAPTTQPAAGSETASAPGTAPAQHAVRPSN